MCSTGVEADCLDWSRDAVSLNEAEAGRDDFGPLLLDPAPNEVDELGLTGVPPRCRAPCLSACSSDFLTTIVKVVHQLKGVVCAYLVVV